jgi:hypothetical protein
MTSGGSPDLEGTLGHFTAISFAGRAVRLACALACVLLLGGCGAVEFQGKIFDYMGLSGDLQQKDVQMADRAPLVVPPNLNTLPPPGTSAAVATARPDWPNNPEQVRQQIAEDKKAKQDQLEAENDPVNPYAGKPTLLDKLFGRKKADQQAIPDVPEPDPSDKVPSDNNTVAQAHHTPAGPQALEPTPNEDAFHPAAPDSYKSASDPSGGSLPGY